MRDEELYLHRVEKAIEQLRTKCLGQDTALAEVLPSHFKQASQGRQAAQIAEQITYSLAAVSSQISPSELEESRQWLYGIVLYLLTNCNANDQSLGAIKRILEMPKQVRRILFLDADSQLYAVLREDAESPECLRDSFDAAVYRVLVSVERQKNAQEVYENLKEILKKQIT